MTHLARTAPLLLAFCLLASAATASAEGVRVEVVAAKFLQMSMADQKLYAAGVLDTLTALGVEHLIPQKLVVCSRNISYGELISGVHSYLYKGLGSEEPAVKEAMNNTPVSVWIVRSYLAKCEGREP